MIFVAVEVSPVGNEPPAAVVVRISKDGRYDLGLAAPFLTKTSSLQRKSGGSAIMPEKVEVFGPS